MTHTFINVDDAVEFQHICDQLGLRVEMAEWNRMGAVVVVASFSCQWRWLAEGGRALTLFGSDVAFLEKGKFSDQYITSFPSEGKEFVCHLD